jgi:hypothetical protein
MLSFVAMARSSPDGEYRMEVTELPQLNEVPCSCHVSMLQSLTVLSDEPVASVALSGEKSNEQVYEWAWKG